jgi:hypothetical protein
VIHSTVEKEYLPFIIDQRTINSAKAVCMSHYADGMIGCALLCNVFSDFSRLEVSSFKPKNRHVWSLGDKYYLIEYCVKVVLGPVSPDAYARSRFSCELIYSHFARLICASSYVCRPWLPPILLLLISRPQGSTVTTSVTQTPYG